MFFYLCVKSLNTFKKTYKSVSIAQLIYNISCLLAICDCIVLILLYDHDLFCILSYLCRSEKVLTYFLFLFIYLKCIYY